MAQTQLDEAVEKGKARETEYEGEGYLRLADDFRDLPRGTAVFSDATIYGYPHIGRLLALEPGLDEHFEAPFWVEEKVDGYNVRIFRHGDQIYGLSRGGFVCPFTTDRAPDFIDPQLFEDHPDLVVCAEVAGPGNPYLESSPPYVTEDVQFLVFDLMRFGQSGFLPQPEKADIVERYGLPSVQRFGRYSAEDRDALHGILLTLNEQGCEGVVFKEDSERDRRAKYVTGNSNISDIGATAHNILDLPPEYFTNRILRLVLFSNELGVARTGELDRRLGAAFLDGLSGAVEQYRREQRVYRTFTCRFRQQANAERLMRHLKASSSHQIQISQRDLHREDNYWVLTFERIYPGMNGLLGHLLGGGLVFD